MGKKNKGKDRYVVYSTNEDYDFDSYEEEQETLDPSEQKLIVSLDRKQRKGKSVTLVEGFIGAEEDLKDLGKFLKTKLGVGGSAKTGQIIVQGDLKQKTADLLRGEGYTVKVH